VTAVNLALKLVLFYRKVCEIGCQFAAVDFLEICANCLKACVFRTIWRNCWILVLACLREPSDMNYLEKFIGLLFPYLNENETSRWDLFAAAWSGVFIVC